MQVRNPVVTLMSLVVVGLLLSACNRGVNPPIPGREDPYIPEQVSLTDPDLRKRTAMQTPNVTRDAQTGILYIQLPIRSTTNKQLRIQYRFAYFDQNGQQINQTGWIDHTLAPNVYTRLTGNSMGPNAADFEIEIRPAQ